jgi:acetoin:2,6-dichlorophenolindophenol oxidoreductase subunit alpha
MGVVVSEPIGRPSPAAIADVDLELMLLIRSFETKLLDLFAKGKIPGTTHTCLGQEHIPVALHTEIGDDYVFSNHRGHGHYLARFRDCHGLLAEIMGREGAVCNGVGGSQHILRERYLSTGVQGASVPVAVGAALQVKRTEPGHMAVVHIGDGTWGEGAVYEGLNMAALWQVPLLMVVENNGIAQSTPTEAHLAGSIAERVRAFGIDYQLVTGTDVTAIRRLLAPLIERLRKQSRPLVVEFRTVRLGPHSKGDDTRSPAELAHIQQQDWYLRYASVDPDRFAAIAHRQSELIDQVVEDVEGRPPARWPAR